MRGLYDGEVVRADRQFGRFLALLRFLGRYESSVVILTADHGEEFAEHRGFGHTRTLYEELLHVPLLVKLPHGAHAGRRVRERVSLTDVVPTILELAGLRAEEGALDGRSIADPDRVPAGRTLLAETNPWVEEPASGDWIHRRIDLRAAVSGDLKCIENRLERDRFGDPAERWAGYDLAADPDEQTPIAGDGGATARCAEQLQRFFGQGEARGSGSESLGEEERAALRALGYLD
jgi:arylsulfatase A-like enzyme